MVTDGASGSVNAVKGGRRVCGHVAGLAVQGVAAVFAVDVAVVQRRAHVAAAAVRPGDVGVECRAVLAGFLGAVLAGFLGEQRARLLAALATEVFRDVHVGLGQAPLAPVKPPVVPRVRPEHAHCQQDQQHEDEAPSDWHSDDRGLEPKVTVVVPIAVVVFGIRWAIFPCWCRT